MSNYKTTHTVHSDDWQYLTKAAGLRVTCLSDLPPGVTLQFRSASGRIERSQNVDEWFTPYVEVWAKTTNGPQDIELHGKVTSLPFSF